MPKLTGNHRNELRSLSEKELLIELLLELDDINSRTSRLESIAIVMSIILTVVDTISAVILIFSRVVPQ